MRMVQYVLDSIATQPIVIHVKENCCLVFIQTAPFVVLIPFKNKKKISLEWTTCGPRVSALVK